MSIHQQIRANAVLILFSIIAISASFSYLPSLRSGSRNRCFGSCDNNDGPHRNPWHCASTPATHDTFLGLRHPFRMRVIDEASLDPHRLQAWANNAKIMLDRVDTMRAAGLASDPNNPPLCAVSPANVFKIGAVALLLKYLRTRFMLKNSKFNEFQPNWNHVITSPEEEKSLHAWTCKKCGSTLFVAKGRELRFFNRFVKCYNCGAKGKDNFYDRRGEIAADDDIEDFQYESPVNYKMSSKQRKTLLEKAEKDKEEAGKVATAEKSHADFGDEGDEAENVESLLVDHEVNEDLMIDEAGVEHDGNTFDKSVLPLEEIDHDSPDRDIELLEEEHFVDALPVASNNADVMKGTHADLISTENANIEDIVTPDQVTEKRHDSEVVQDAIIEKNDEDASTTRKPRTLGHMNSDSPLPSGSLDVLGMDDF